MQISQVFYKKSNFKTFFTWLFDSLMEMVCKLKGYYHIYSDTDYSDSLEEFFGIHRMSD